MKDKVKIEKLNTDGIITESRTMTKAVFVNVTKKQLDLILYFASLIKKDDDEFCTYEISFNEIAKLFCRSNPRTKAVKKTVDEAIKHIMSTQFCILDKRTECRYYYQIVRACKYDPRKETITFRLSDELKQFYLLLEKTKYTTYALKEILKLKTLTDVRIYQWCYAKKDFENDVPISIEDAKLVFYGKDIETKEIIRRIKESIARINELTGLHVDFEKVYKSKERENKISSLKFHIETNYDVVNEIETKKSVMEEINNILDDIDVRQLSFDATKLPDFIEDNEDHPIFED